MNLEITAKAVKEIIIRICKGILYVLTETK